MHIACNSFLCTYTVSIIFTETVNFDRCRMHRLSRVGLLRTGVSKCIRPLSSTEQVLRKYPNHNQTHRLLKRHYRITPLMFDIKTIETPTFPDSVTEGDIMWIKEVGDAVDEDEVIGEIETDKTTLPVQSPAAGVLTELLVADGDTISKGTLLAKIDLGAGVEAPAAAPAAAAAPEPTPAPAAEPVPAAAPAADLGPAPASPGTPPPMPSAPLSVTPPPLPKAAAPPAVAPGELKPPGLRTENAVKMSRMRLRIAERLKEAQNTAAMLTTFNEIDMTNIMALRSKFKDDFLKKHGVKLGFMSAFLKASATGLKEMPEVNAFIDGKEIIYRDYVDISVAVATPKGLVVPVLRNVETMSYADIEIGLTELGKKARDGNLAIEDMDGGTFTVSNGGVFGSMFGTPIINLPQSAILGMHAIQQRPVALNGNVVIRPMMYIALTYDHRLIDGREAVTFLKRVKSAVEDPALLLLDI